MNKIWKLLLKKKIGLIFKSFTCNTFLQNILLFIFNDRIHKRYLSKIWIDSKSIFKLNFFPAKFISEVLLMKNFSKKISKWKIQVKYLKIYYEILKIVINK
jgi:hypothetical protein